LDALWKLKLDVPANLDDVETTVKTLEEKKAKWVADQATATVAAKQKAEEKIAALRAKAAKMDEAKPVEVNGDE
jgi:hypothetical protein